MLILRNLEEKENNPLASLMAVKCQYFFLLFSNSSIWCYALINNNNNPMSTYSRWLNQSVSKNKDVMLSDYCIKESSLAIVFFNSRNLLTCMNSRILIEWLCCFVQFIQFSPILGRHHCRWRAKYLVLWSALMVFEQRGLLIMLSHET